MTQEKAMRHLGKMRRYGSRFAKLAVKQAVAEGKSPADTLKLVKCARKLRRIASLGSFVGESDPAFRELNLHGQGMSVLADSLLTQTLGANPFVFDVGPSFNQCVIAPSGTGMAGQFDNLVK